MKSSKILEGTRLNVFRLINKGYGKFSDLQKLTDTKSNELSYHLKALVDSGLVEKEAEGDIVSYSLSEKGKQIYPYLKIITEEEIPVVVITAVACVKDGKVMMFEKKDEPHKGTLILVGGKARVENTIEESAVKKCKEQVGLKVKDLKLRCINEFIEKEGKEMKHHWLVYFYTATAENEPESVIWVDLDKLKEYDLFGDNYFFLGEMIHNKEVKITKTTL